MGTCVSLILLSAGLPKFALGQTRITTVKEQNPAAARGRQSAGPKVDSGSHGYVIDAGDLLYVYVLDVAQLSRDYRVSPGGTIAIPLLSSPVTAEGLTLNQLAVAISQKLISAGLVSHPHVTVMVKSSRAHAVAISGAVKSPQVYRIFGPTTLLDVLSQAGGLAPDAGSNAIITRGRAADGVSSSERDLAAPHPEAGVIKVNLRKLLATGDPSLDVTVYPGDKVTVQRAGVVYVVGAVRRPGGFTLSSGREKMTVLQAVALGEGLKSTALKKKALIIRRGRQFPAGREEVPVNLKKTLAGQAPDPFLEANDILFVPDSASKRALQRGAEAIVQMATGIVILDRY